MANTVLDILDLDDLYRRRSCLLRQLELVNKEINKRILETKGKSILKDEKSKPNIKIKIKRESTQTILSENSTNIVIHKNKLEVHPEVHPEMGLEKKSEEETDIKPKKLVIRIKKK